MIPTDQAINLTIDVAEAVGMDDLTDRECALIELGMAIAAAQTESGEDYPDDELIDEKFFDDADERDEARDTFAEHTCEAFYGSDTQLAVWYTRGRSDRPYGA
jgi:hypothetical protein